MYSVSLSTDDHRYRRMLKGFSWACDNFPEVLTYLGNGFLLETTLQITGTPRELLEQAVSSISAQTERDLKLIDPTVRFWKASESHSDPDFQIHHANVKSAYTHDLSIKNSIDDDADAYVQRLTKNSRLQLPADMAKKLATDYIIFEIAGYSLLASRGYLVDVYASGSGELPTLEKFMREELKGFPALETRACIILKT